MTYFKTLFIPVALKLILTKNEAVHPIAVSENHSTSGMLSILIKVQTVSILSNILPANSHILYLKVPN